MATILKIVQDNKAEKLLRFVNFILDFPLCFLLIIILSSISIRLYSFFTSSDLTEVAYSIANMNEYLKRLLIILSYAIFMFLFEFLTNGRSLGKLITGTIVVKTDATDLTVQDYFKRNICRAIPFESFSFIGKNGWHDTIYDTRVVKKKAYEKAQSQKIDLDNLGKGN